MHDNFVGLSTCTCSLSKDKEMFLGFVCRMLIGWTRVLPYDLTKYACF